MSQNLLIANSQELHAQYIIFNDEEKKILYRTKHNLNVTIKQFVIIQERCGIKPAQIKNMWGSGKRSSILKSDRYNILNNLYFTGKCRQECEWYAAQKRELLSLKKFKTENHGDVYLQCCSCWKENYSIMTQWELESWLVSFFHLQSIDPLGLGRFIIKTQLEFHQRTIQFVEWLDLRKWMRGLWNLVFYLHTAHGAEAYIFDAFVDIFRNFVVLTLRDNQCPYQKLT